jgi:hypothetical protein
MSSVSSVKAEARRLVEQLPEDATWEDLMYQISVRQAVGSGLKDVQQGCLVSTLEVRKRLGLPT